MRPRSAGALTETELVAAYRNSGSEDDLLQTITDAATFLGWRWHHVRRSDRALQMGHPGFPDLILARAGRVLAIELKTARGRVGTGQADWLRDLSGSIDALVVRPDDLDELLRSLE